jgi:hypothetical protein
MRDVSRKRENNNIKSGCYKKPVDIAPPAHTRAQLPCHKGVWLVARDTPTHCVARRRSPADLDS